MVDLFALYTSNSYPNSEKRYELIFGWGAREVFTDHQVVSDTLGDGWKFGFLGYELRTQFESVTQENDALGQWPHTQFFTPEVAGVLHTDGTLEIWAEDAVAARTGDARSYGYTTAPTLRKHFIEF